MLWIGKVPCCMGYCSSILCWQPKTRLGGICRRSNDVIAIDQRHLRQSSGAERGVAWELEPELLWVEDEAEEATRVPSTTQRR